jgi:hypothetical protein
MTHESNSQATDDPAVELCKPDEAGDSRMVPPRRRAVNRRLYSVGRKDMNTRNWPQLTIIRGISRKQVTYEKTLVLVHVLNAAIRVKQLAHVLLMS